MEQDWPVEIGVYPESRVRALGFDPSYLTPDEQAELLELHSGWPDDGAGAGAEEDDLW